MRGETRCVSCLKFQAAAPPHLGEGGSGGALSARGSVHYPNGGGEAVHGGTERAAWSGGVTRRQAGAGPRPRDRCGDGDAVVAYMRQQRPGWRGGARAPAQARRPGGSCGGGKCTSRTLSHQSPGSGRRRSPGSCTRRGMRSRRGSCLGGTSARPAPASTATCPRPARRGAAWHGLQRTSLATMPVKHSAPMMRRMDPATNSSAA